MVTSTAALIYNPIKVDLDALRAAVEAEPVNELSAADQALTVAPHPRAARS